ncbi:MAG: dihydrofolate reductase family protein [Candidatus Paceibacterota bacterium]
MIKCFIIAALTTDGFLAKDKDQISTSWNSTDDRKHFVELTKRAGVVVFGSTTFETFGRPLKDRLNIVYSRSKKYEGVEMTNDEPESLLKKLEDRGFKEVAICGGSTIYTKFLKAGVVDTIYLTVEPVIFGKGITLFNEDVECKLELVSESHTPQGTIFLEYKILK